MKPFYISLKFSATLLILTTLIWWLVEQSGFDIPVFIPHTPIKIYGLVLFTVELTLLIMAIKAFYRLDNELSVLKLALRGAFVMFLSEVVFQFIISFTNEYDKLYYYFRGLIVMNIFGFILSLAISFQLKTKKTKVLIWTFVGLTILVAITQQFFPNLFPN